MFNTIGDDLAIQYGGSESHKKVQDNTQSNDSTSEIITSIKRYYNNSFTDRLKQDAMNLFLGKYIPEQFHSFCPLWGIDTDYYLHHKYMREGVSIINPLGPWYDGPLQQFELSQFPSNYMCSRDLSKIYTVENSLLGRIPYEISLLKSNDEEIPTCSYCSSKSDGSLFCPNCHFVIIPVEKSIQPANIYTDISDQSDILLEYYLFYFKSRKNIFI